MNTSGLMQDFLRRLAQLISKMDDLDRFLNLLTQTVVDIFELTWANLSLLDETCGQYKIKSRAKREEMPDEALPRLDDSASWLKDRQRIVCKRLLEEFGSQMAPSLVEQLNKEAIFVSMPLFVENRMIGILNLGAKANRKIFSSEEVKLLGELSPLIAACVEEAMHYHLIVEQRLHHQNILDNLVSGILVIDSEGKITVFNRAAERILKVHSEQILGKDVRLLQADLADLILDTLHKGRTYRRQELYIVPDNILIGVSTSQFYDNKGKLLGACMVFSNLAEIKKRELSARERDLDAYWSNVANSLAHQVKNSIVAAKIFTEMFPQKYTDAEFRWSLYSTLKRDMARLDSFTEKVLKFAQCQKISIQSCEMDKVMDAAISSALEDRDIGGIAFEKKYSQNIEHFPGDYYQLKEAFVQIISNALEAMGKQGKLSISIEQESSPQLLIYSLPQAIKELPESSLIVVKISDTGCGVLPENRAHLFEPFFTTKEGRPGLGLATARKIIERHKGVIRAESTPEQGSAFWVCLPLMSEMKISKA